MKYWLYSEGNILGPYAPAEMLALPSFTEESLVCAETSTGDNADDWRPAAQMGEISSLLSVGTGRAVASGIRSSSYDFESASASSISYFEEKSPEIGGSYSELLDTIDDILGTRKGGKDFETQAPKETDYELAEKFDIRLSRIQEELEAARWEKNLLLEKMRIKELEDKKNRERINELEARLKGELRSVEQGAKEFEQVRHLTDLKEKSDTFKKIEELKKEQLSLERHYPEVKQSGPEDDRPGALPPAEETPAQNFIGPASKSLKSVTPSGQLNLERHTDTGEGQKTDDSGLASRKLKSVGQTQPPAYVYGSDIGKPLSDNYVPPVTAPSAAPAPAAAPILDYRDTPLPGPEAAPAGAFKGFGNMEPLPQQAGGVVYDFTVVTSKPDEGSQKFNIEPDAAQAQPAWRQPQPAQAAPQQAPAQRTFQTPQQASPMEFVPVSSPAPAFQGQPQPVQPQTFNPSFQQPAQAWGKQTSSPLASQGQSTSFSPSAPESGAEPFAGLASDKTQRISKEALDDAPKDAKKTVVQATKALKVPGKSAKKGGKMAFIAGILLFGCIAAGGLGYFFLGDGNLSEFSMLNFKSGKKTAAAASRPDEGAAAPAAGQPAAAGQAQAGQPVQPQAGQQAAPETAPQSPQTETQPAEQPAAAPEKSANENIRKALEIVKAYKLSGGRGSIESWFANSFLSGGAGGTNEEWTATPLHGDILVVQYRLLRPKQDPMIYQFEVDSVKGDIVRGLNNNAIELLDLSSKKVTASAEPVKKHAAKPKAKKQPSRPKEVPILPLPEDTDVKQASDPTGFEQPENNEKVKYLKAQESDEELF